MRVRNSANTIDILSAKGDGNFEVNGYMGVNCTGNPAYGQMVLGVSGNSYGSFVHANAITSIYSCYLAQPYRHGFYVAQIGIGAAFEAEGGSGSNTNIGFAAAYMPNNSANNIGAHFDVTNGGVGNAYALYISNGDILFGSGGAAGTKIGTTTSEKFAFWAATPIVQPTTGVGAATLTGGGGATLTDTDTFDGYTLKQVVKALRNMGLLA